MLSSCTPSEVVRTLRYVFFGCFCYQSSCLLIYLGTGVFIQMLGHENNSKHVVLPRSTPYLDLVHGPPSVRPLGRTPAPGAELKQKPVAGAGGVGGL